MRCLSLLAEFDAALDWQLHDPLVDDPQEGLEGAASGHRVRAANKETRVMSTKSPSSIDARAQQAG